MGWCPANRRKAGGGCAGDQTNAMLAVVRVDDESLVPPQAAGLALFPPKPLRWVSAGALLGGNKSSRFAFFQRSCMGVGSLPSGCCGCVGITPRGVYFSRKNGFLRVGALRRRTRCSLLHTVLFGRSYMGGGITTLGARFMLLKRWTPTGHGGLFAVFMPSRNSPCVG